MIEVLFKAPAWVFVLLPVLVVLAVAVLTYRYHYPKAHTLHWQLQTYSPLRALRAFALGLYEYKQEYTPYFAHDSLSAAYLRGRQLANRLTFTKYEV